MLKCQQLLAFLTFMSSMNIVLSWVEKSFINSEPVFLLLASDVVDLGPELQCLLLVKEDLI